MDHLESEGNQRQTKEVMKISILFLDTQNLGVLGPLVFAMLMQAVPGA